MEPQHECEMVERGGWWLLSECPEDGTGSSLVGIVIGIVVLGLVGVGVWWLVKGRHG